MTMMRFTALCTLGLTMAFQSALGGPKPESWKEMVVEKLTPIDRASVAGQGPQPVIILAELGCDETAYADFAKRHADRFTTHTLVLPGAARDSKAPPLARGQIRDPEWLVNAVAAVVDYAKSRKIEKPVIIGQGAGATVAYMLVAREPEFAKGVVVINALPAASVGGPGRIPMKESRAAEVDKLERANLVAMNQAAWIKRIEQVIPLQTTDPKRALWLYEMQSKAPATSMRRYMLEPLYLDLREDLDGTQTPVLVIGTLADWLRENDRLMLRAAFQNVAYNRPNVRLEIVEGARSWLILDDPNRFDTVLCGFLGIEPPAPAPAAQSEPPKPTPTVPPAQPGEGEKK